MRAELLLVFLLCVFDSSRAQSVTFMLYDNGASEGGVEVQLWPEDFPSINNNNYDDGRYGNPGELFAMEMSQNYINVSKYGQEPGTVTSISAFREDGEQITRFEQLQPDQQQQEELRRVYLVAEGLQFIWPFVALGHNQTVSTNALPPVIDNLPIVLESLSDKPRLFKVHNMFTKEESEALIANALSLTGAEAMQTSTVGTRDAQNNKNTRGSKDSGRTSENAWDHKTPTAKGMISKSFNLTRIVEDSGQIDGLQIVRYQPGQGYNTHPDYLVRPNIKEFDFNPYSGGSNRWATVFMYLNDVEEGGNTVFPKAEPGTYLSSPSSTPPQYALDMFQPHRWEYRLTEECYSRLAVPPRQGVAALFYSVLPDGRVDPMSMHGACPVIKGLKWGANIWIWNKQRYGDIKTGDPRKLTISNTFPKETVYITWEGRPNGKLAPGQQIGINTFEFHRFKASLTESGDNGDHPQEFFAEFAVQNQPEKQTWTIQPPRDYHHNHNHNDPPPLAATNKQNNNNDTTNKEQQEQEELKRQLLRAKSSCKIAIVNTLPEETVYINYDGKPWATVAPGSTLRGNTFVSHQFQACLNSYEDDLFAEFTVQAGAKHQRWLIESPTDMEDEEL